MAEVQTSKESGEMTQQFIEFVMMHQHQAAFCLGLAPHPATGRTELNLDAAKMFIDQLAMIRAKTRGNLSNDEQAVLNNAISSLQMAFFEVAQEKGGAARPPAADHEAEPEPATSEEQRPVETAGAAPDERAEGGGVETAAEAESKKKFTKSYGS